MTFETSKIVKSFLLNFIQGACEQKIPPSFNPVHFLNVKTNVEIFEFLSFNYFSIVGGKGFVKRFPPLKSKKSKIFLNFLFYPLF